MRLQPLYTLFFFPLGLVLSMPAGGDGSDEIATLAQILKSQKIRVQMINPFPLNIGPFITEESTNVSWTPQNNVDRLELWRGTNTRDSPTGFQGILCHITTVSHCEVSFNTDRKPADDYYFQLKGNNSSSIRIASSAFSLKSSFSSSGTQKSKTYIIGIIVGIIVFLIVVVSTFHYFCFGGRRRKTRKKSRDNNVVFKRSVFSTSANSSPFGSFSLSKTATREHVKSVGERLDADKDGIKTIPT